MILIPETRKSLIISENGYCPVFGTPDYVFNTSFIRKEAVDQFANLITPIVKEISILNTGDIAVNRFCQLFQKYNIKYIILNEMEFQKLSKEIS